MEINLSKTHEDIAAKRAEKIAYLEAKRAERESVKETRKAAARPIEVGTISTAEQFWKAFNDGIRDLKAGLETAAAGGLVTEEQCKELADGWHGSLAGLQLLLNDCTLFLPPFDVRKAQSIVDSSQEEVAATQQKIVPRKRFQFSKKPAAGAAAGAGAGAAGAEAGSGTASASIGEAAATAAAGKGSTSSSSSSSSSLSHYDEDEFTVTGHSSKVLLVTASKSTGQLELLVLADVSNLSSPADAEAWKAAHLHSLETDAEAAAGAAGAAAAGGEPSTSSSESASSSSSGSKAAGSHGKDLRLLDLHSCVILLMGINLRALRIDNLSDCIVYANPIAGSVLLHNCKSCRFFLSCRQTRIHTSTDCHYYLQVMSRPIIEHCKGLSFAPNTLCYSGSERDLAAAGLTLNKATSDLWRSVDDFGWHRVQKSPNWSELPEEARQSIILPADLTTHLPSLRHLSLHMKHAGGAGASAGGAEAGAAGEVAAAGKEEAAAPSAAASPAPTSASGSAPASAPASSGGDDDEL